MTATKFNFMLWGTSVEDLKKQFDSGAYTGNNIEDIRKYNKIKAEHRLSGFFILVKIYALSLIDSSTFQATHFITEYFNQFPRIQDYLNQIRLMLQHNNGANSFPSKDPLFVCAQFDIPHSCTGTHTYSVPHETADGNNSVLKFVGPDKGLSKK